MSDPIGRIASQVIKPGGDTGLSLQVPVLQDRTAHTKSFSDTLKDAVNSVSQQQDVANDYATRFANGDQVEVHQVMASAEEASLSLNMLVEIRNKFVDAYHTIVSMQA